VIVISWIYFLARRFPKRITAKRASALRHSCTLLAAPFVSVLATQEADANVIPLGGATNYAVLYATGANCTNQLSISNDTIKGNIGIAGCGEFAYSGPGNITGRLDYSAANTGGNQYQNSNHSSLGPTSVNYNVSNVATDLTNLGILSLDVAYPAGNTSQSAYGTNLAIANGNTTVSESSGQLDTLTINGNTTTYRIFDVTSYSANNASVLTINSDGSGDPVVFNFDYSGNTNLGGEVVLSGLSDDQVLFNFTSTNKNVSLTNNGEVFQGIILAPNDNLSLDNTNLDGRVFGGADGNMQIVSGANIFVPEPSTLSLFGAGLGSVFAALFWPWRRGRTKEKKKQMLQIASPTKQI
jgi:choice-of-anchor A domain-containing protein